MNQNTTRNPALAFWSSNRNRPSKYLSSDTCWDFLTVQHHADKRIHFRCSISALASCSQPQGQRSPCDGPHFKHPSLSSLAMLTKAHFGFFSHIFTPLSQRAKCHAEFWNIVPQYARRRTNEIESRRTGFSSERDNLAAREPVQK